MGQLVNGVWTKGSVSNNQKDGSFKRVDSVFRNVISVNDQVYKPETNRYHLYVSYACPWAHRTLIFRYLKFHDKVKIKSSARLKYNARAQYLQFNANIF